LYLVLLECLYKHPSSRFLGHSQGREEQKKQRQLDLERLLQRYQNVKSELESQQNIERIRAEKFMGYHMTAKAPSQQGASRQGSSASLGGDGS
jgi:hypothetical protein